MRSEMSDKTISTVKVNDLYEVAVNFNNSDEWNIVGRYDYKTAIIKHESLEKLSTEKIMFQLRYLN